MKILVVEDDENSRIYLERALKSQNYTVESAQNGVIALDKAVQSPPDMIISDIMMPEMDGFDLCRKVKANDQLRQIPFIFYTATFIDKRDEELAISLGASRFIVKPIKIQDFFKIINDIIEEHKDKKLPVTEKTLVEKEKIDEMYSEALARKLEKKVTQLQIEIAERKRAEEELCKVNRALKTLSESNRSLVRSFDESRLLHDLCRIIVETGGYRLAWIGFAQQDEKFMLRILAQYGYEEKELEGMKISPADMKTCAGKAILTGKPCIVRNILTDPDHSKHRAEANRRGYASSISFPLTTDDRPSGVLNIYAKEPDAFDNEEVKLLAEMADDLAFGIKTLRMRAKHEKAEIEINRQASIIKNIPESVCTMDLKGNILSWNDGAEKMLGYKKEEIIGQPITITIPEELAQKELEHYLGILNKKGFFTDYESVRLTKDGRIIPVEITGVALRDEKITAYASMMKDITERKNAVELRIEKEALEYASKAKSEFLANMSHELRTPLNSSIGFSELLKQGIAGELSEKQKHYVDNILKSNQFLLSLINDILDLSKIEAGKIEIVPENMSVSATIKETLSLIKEKAMKHKVLLKTEFGPELEYIEADKQRFKQILFNLLSNAVKFSKEEGGTVTITTKKEGEMAQISVSDTGIGIKEENIGKLFQKFEQLESGICQKYGGTGLGLAITKQLVELHGGKILAQSRYGEGSTFTFLVPIESRKREKISL